MVMLEALAAAEETRRVELEEEELEREMEEIEDMRVSLTAPRKPLLKPIDNMVLGKVGGKVNDVNQTPKNKFGGDDDDETDILIPATLEDDGVTNEAGDEDMAIPATLEFVDVMEKTPVASKSLVSALPEIDDFDAATQHTLLVPSSLTDNVFIESTNIDDDDDDMLPTQLVSQATVAIDAGSEYEATQKVL